MTSEAPLTPQKVDGGNEGRESELKKQEMLVQYLKDTESFALQVERAIAVINNMLYWKTTTGNYYKVPAFFINNSSNIRHNTEEEICCYFGFIVTFNMYKLTVFSFL